MDAGSPQGGWRLAESNVGFQMSDKGNVKTEVVMVELKQFRMVLTNIDELPEDMLAHCRWRPAAVKAHGDRPAGRGAKRGRITGHPHDNL